GACDPPAVPRTTRCPTSPSPARSRRTGLRRRRRAYLPCDPVGAPTSGGRPTASGGRLPTASGGRLPPAPDGRSPPASALGVTSRCSLGRSHVTGEPHFT